MNVCFDYSRADMSHNTQPLLTPFLDHSCETLLWLDLRHFLNLLLDPASSHHQICTALSYCRIQVPGLQADNNFICTLILAPAEGNDIFLLEFSKFPARRHWFHLGPLQSQILGTFVLTSSQLYKLIFLEGALSKSGPALWPRLPRTEARFFGCLAIFILSPYNTYNVVFSVQKRP
jgi:hypothetical protein